MHINHISLNLELFFGLISSLHRTNSNPEDYQLRHSSVHPRSPTIPGALGYDGDSAYYETLRTKVLADKVAEKTASEKAAKERRMSLGLPEKEHRRRKDEMPKPKKSVGVKSSELHLDRHSK